MCKAGEQFAVKITAGRNRPSSICPCTLSENNLWLYAPVTEFPQRIFYDPRLVDDL
jgi:hypothetical protein